MPSPQSPWMDLNITPAEAPTVERCSMADEPTTYALTFERASLTVMLTADQLQELVARALIAQAVAD